MSELVPVPIAPTPMVTLQTMKLPSGLVPVLCTLQGLWRTAALLTDLGVPPLTSHAATGAEYWHCGFPVCCSVWRETHVLGALTQRHRLGESSNMLLVCANSAKVRAERRTWVLLGDSCTCSHAEQSLLSPQVWPIHGKFLGGCRRVPGLTPSPPEA